MHSLQPERIASRILLVRGRKVMLDADLADLYGVATGALVQAVKRNPRRFPPDFMFQLTEQEVGLLKSQTVIFAVDGIAVLGQKTQSSLCIFRAWSRDVVFGAAQRSSYRREYCNHACLRTFARDGRGER